MSGDGGGGASRGRKREHHEEHEEHVNHEAWVIPYADVLTLLMALFLVLFALGRTDSEKAEVAALSFEKEVTGENIFDFGISVGGGRDGGTGGSGPLANGAIGVLDGVGPKPAATAEGTGGGLSPDTGEARPTMIVVAPDGTVTETPALGIEPAGEGEVTYSDPLTYVEESVRARAEGTGLLDSIGFRREPRGLVVTILTDQVVFNAGAADIQPTGLQLLDVVADSLAPLSNDVMVEGHTDSRPISTTRYPSNWELSTARATSVLRYLVEARGFPSDRISAAGYADTRPVDGGSSNDALARNRRVEIVVLDTRTNVAAAPAATAPAASDATTAPVSDAEGDDATHDAAHDATDHASDEASGAAHQDGSHG
jgi:chemotaxis protein MotB